MGSQSRGAHDHLTFYSDNGKTSGINTWKAMMNEVASGSGLAVHIWRISAGYTAYKSGIDQRHGDCCIDWR